jgi:glycosyltransferase involved in cell wall biosynthesis
MNWPGTLMHVLGHPTLPLDLTAAPEDAQLQNCRNFCLLLAELGIPYKYYGIHGSKIPSGGEFVDCRKATGSWKYGNSWHRTYNQRLNRALTKNIRRDEQPQWISSLYGAAQSDIEAQGLPVIEPMLGYDHCWAPYRVFPSYAHQQVIYTLQDEFTWNSRFFDTVIPHFIDEKDFPFAEAHAGYLLYLGRNIPGKGVDLAKQCAERCGLPLRLAFAGYHGRAKAELIGAALAVLMPTLYLEPFGYVAIEAQMCGTPVICTDWGAFPETVEQGVSGFRCRTAAEFQEAVKCCGKLDRRKIRERALAKFSLGAIAKRYSDYFEFVWNIHKNGGYYAKRAWRKQFSASSC